MSAALVAAAVTTRLGNNRMVQLTNDDPSATTIDSVVLLAACSDAIGDFERMTGVTEDSTNITHMALLVQGAQCFLEDYKSRDGGIMNSRMKRFVAACKDLGRRVYSTATSNSPLQSSTQRQGSRPDMDRKNKVWSAGTIGGRLPESWGN